MTALGYYANASKYVMDSDELNDNYLLLLQEALNPLRFYLACRVCNKLLKNPMTPDHTACQHTVCSSCVGGKMRLKPSCGWCQGYENFKINKSLALLVKCYSKLCQYVLSSDHYHKQLAFVNNDSRNEIQTYKERVSTLLKEGCDYNTHPVTSSSDGDSEDQPNTNNNSNSNSNISPNANKISRTSVIVTEPSCHTLDNHPTFSSQPPCQEELDSRRKEKRLLSIRNQFQTSQKPDGNLDNTSAKKAKLPDRAKIDKKGCGCGTATTTPGKLTCYGQRCPCYSNHNPCIDCRCRGCRNPNKFIKIEQASEDTDNDEINVDL